MNAYEAILEALIARERTGEGAELSVSMFDAMADWMAVPLLQQESGKPPQRVGLAHTVDRAVRRVPQPRRRRNPHLHPERPRMARAGGARFWAIAALAADPAFATNIERVKRRAETDGKVAAKFGTLDAEALMQIARRCRYRFRARQ